MDNQQVYALITDIGGTNTRIQLVLLNQNEKTPQVLKEFYKLTSNYSNLEIILEECLQEFKNTIYYPQYAVIGIAGPIVNNTCIITDIGWPLLEAKSLSKSLNIPHVKLINDFEAIGYSLQYLPDSAKIIINEGVQVEGAPITVIGPGTGLGFCNLFSSHRKGKNVYDVYPSEGGSISFCAQTEFDWELCKFLKEKYYLQYMHVEPIVSGTGIQNIYEYLEQQEAERNSPFDIHVNSIELGRLILQNALNKTDKVCEETIEHFLRYYGREAGKLGLYYLARGGIYLVGNLSVALSEKLKDPQGSFLKGYFENDLERLLKEFPIILVNIAELGLLGAYVEAIRLWEGIDSEDNL